MATIARTRTQTQNDPAVDNRDDDPIEDADYHWIDFFVFKPIARPANKLGEIYTSMSREKRLVADWGFQHDDFLMDCGENMYDEQFYHPLVTKLTRMGRDKGRAKFRNLQPLWFPWGIDGSLPFCNRDYEPKPLNVPVFENPITNIKNVTAAQEKYLQDAAIARGIPFLALSIRRLVKAICDFDDAAEAAAANSPRQIGVQLPICRVLKSQAVGTDVINNVKRAPFFAGEYVLAFGRNAQDLNEVWVRDYEGNIGIFQKQDLQEVVNPFGLRLHKGELDQLLWELEGPDDEDDPDGHFDADRSPEASATGSGSGGRRGGGGGGTGIMQIRGGHRRRHPMKGMSGGVKRHRWEEGSDEESGEEGPLRKK